MNAISVAQEHWERGIPVDKAGGVGLGTDYIGS